MQAPRRQASPSNGGSRSKDLFGTMPPRNEKVQKVRLPGSASCSLVGPCGCMCFVQWLDMPIRALPGQSELMHE